MKRTTCKLLSAFALIATMTSSASAWWDEGHMQIALMTYRKLTPHAKDAVDALLKKHIAYNSWIVGIADEKKGETAFMHASVWPDDIKSNSSYIDDKPETAVAGTDSAAFADMNMHKYWHFKDLEFSTDGSHGPEQGKADIATQLKAFIVDIDPASGLSDDIRSYELAWTIHLIGDAHQPLHAITRYSQQDAHPTEGDRGGNVEVVSKATGEETKLHAYWDGIFGGYVTIQGATFDLKGTKLESVAVDPTKAADLNPDHWINESFELAKKFAYAEPVLSSSLTSTAKLTRDYETNTRDIARSQAILGATRFTNVLNGIFK
jgi:S1/P1 Nuclease